MTGRAADQVDVRHQRPRAVAASLRAVPSLLALILFTLLDALLERLGGGMK
jgi:hypothetical protein